MVEQDTIPNEGYTISNKCKKGISKDPNPEAFWVDMPHIVQIAKAKET